MKAIFFYIIGYSCLVFAGSSPNSPNKSIPFQGDPLPSWNDGAVKQSIINYVKTVTDSNSKSFIPVTDRIATFDNDGTLWPERPNVQQVFAYYMVRRLTARTQGLSKTQPFKAVVENDESYFADGGNKAIIELVSATHSGMTQDEFETSVKEFFKSAIYPTRNVRLSQIVYEPQRELLDYLRANGFKTFICTRQTIEFVRGISQQLYGIPKDQVIGTTFKYTFIDSNATILREAVISHLNDKEGKPVGIQTHIGQRPVFACGNEGRESDIAMLKFCQSSRYPSLQVLINHDDSEREFLYEEKSNASLNAAAKNKWQVVSMKKDWKVVFPGELEAAGEKK